MISFIPYVILGIVIGIGAGVMLEAKARKYFTDNGEKNEMD